MKVYIGFGQMSKLYYIFFKYKTSNSYSLTDLSLMQETKSIPIGYKVYLTFSWKNVIIFIIMFTIINYLLK